MARISRDNIEEYLLDYLEGNLDSKTHKEVRDFLLLNPDIEEELIGMEEAYIETPDMSFHEKDMLKQSMSIEDFEDKCIMAVEQQLNREETAALKQEAESNKLKSDILKLYKHTVLSPDKSIVFENKSSLKHRMAFGYRRIMYYSAAAAVVLLISVSSLLMKKQDMQGEYTAEYYNTLNKELQEYSATDSNTSLHKADNSAKEQLANNTEDTSADTPSQKDAEGTKNNTNTIIAGNTAQSEKQTNKETVKTRTIIVGKTTKTEEIAAANTSSGNTSISTAGSIEKVSALDIAAKSIILLAVSMLDSPEPGDIVLQERKNGYADQNDMLVAHESEEWASQDYDSDDNREKKLNTLVRMGESKVRTLLSKFVSVTRIQHERVVYVDEK